ncbi:spore germination protein [Gracilibacillus marinus]|uniref:Spore germination protein n=1 Tax=Gracilibacillus marinus TaxID=630535 RepID=A0ABV8VRL9_9BACI
MRLFPKGKKQKNAQHSINTFYDLTTIMSDSDDFIQVDFGNYQEIKLYYYKSLINTEKLQTNILPFCHELTIDSIHDLANILPFDEKVITTDVALIQEKILSSYIAITFESNMSEVLLIPARFETERAIQAPEIEFSVIGPKLAFIEDIDTNINLIRKRLRLPQLKVKQLRVGKLTKTSIAVVYIDGITNEDNIQTIIQRIEDIEYDQIIDSSFILQMIADNNSSPFPQMMDSERPDRVTSALAEGKVAIICDGSPHVLCGPTNLVEFFSSYEDYFLSWPIATAFRIIRIFAVMFSVLITPLYVAILTYHYQVIPVDLLGTLISSRKDIPFPPILEVLILELTIELLREAGARLPVKIGQTIGIVGGIVIGTAAVEAGLTSNVLLIIVALAALASFTTPIYRIGNTIRLLRFPFILLAQLCGLIGIIIGLVFLIGHLLKLTSLGRPYLEPIFPPRWQDLKDAFIRLPFNKQTTKPIFTQTKDRNRMNTYRANQKMDKRK